MLSPTIQTNEQTNKQNDCIKFSNFIENDDKYIPTRAPLYHPLG